LLKANIESHRKRIITRNYIIEDLFSRVKKNVKRIDDKTYLIDDGIIEILK